MSCRMPLPACAQTAARHPGDWRGRQRLRRHLRHRPAPCGQPVQGPSPRLVHVVRCFPGLVRRLGSPGPCHLVRLALVGVPGQPSKTVHARCRVPGWHGVRSQPPSRSHPPGKHRATGWAPAGPAVAGCGPFLVRGPVRLRPWSGSSSRAVCTSLECDRGPRRGCRADQAVGPALGHVHGVRGRDAEREHPAASRGTGSRCRAACKMTIEDAYTRPSIVPGSSTAVTPLSPYWRTTA